MVGSLLKIVLGVAIGVPLLMWVFQERMLFFPRPLDSRPALRSNVEEVSIVAVDGITLRGWLVKGDGAPAPLVIYFGGNAEEVSWLVDAADHFVGWSLLLVNFRGYGESEGKPGEKELLRDGLVIHDYAKRRPEVNSERIVAMGRSLGSGVAVHLAAHRVLRGVILVSPYDSIVEVAKGHYPFLPVSLMLRHRFDSLALAPQIEAPLLCLVATEDRVIPTAHSRALFKAWHGTKTWHEVPHSDHDSVSCEPEYWRSIADFLKTLR
ncbi:MAG TPA: alpha/beta hydrolase [Burkholderiales bacterium]|nr:alpha/beta hydrolase [Burkholderiales bacterium]